MKSTLSLGQQGLSVMCIVCKTAIVEYAPITLAKFDGWVRHYRPARVTFQNTLADGGRIQSLVRVLTAEALNHSPSG